MTYGYLLRGALGAYVFSALALLADGDRAYAGTIMKLDLGSDSSADISFNGTTLSTANDGIGVTTGDQNTDVDFGDFLSLTPDILLSSASLSLSGLNPAGAPTTLGPLVIQPFSGGSISVYDPANVLLLSGTLANSTLTGTVGAPATGAVFTTSFASVSGGTLAPQLISNSLSLSISLTDVNGGAGFSVTGGGANAVLNPFSADATVNVAADQFVIPEPGTLLLGAAGACMVVACSRRRGVTA